MKVPEKYMRKISKEEINSFPLRQYTGPIHIVDSKCQLDFVMSQILREKVLGFDTESKPSFKKGKSYPPSLLQLACQTSVFIFKLGNNFFPDEIKKILSDSSIIKTGVAVRDDIKGLKRLSAFHDAGFVDIGEISKELGLQTHGLRNLAVNFLGFRISKNKQRSNWGRKRLSHRQIVYAATDAWVSRELHLCLSNLKLI